MSDVDDEVCDIWENYDIEWDNSFGNILLCYVNLSKTTVWSTDWNMGWDSMAVEKEHSKQLANMTMNLEIPE